jgi:multiple sugar transport system substrate-binding protein
VFDEKLGPTPQQALDPNWNNTVSQQMVPKGGVAINIDGSWVSHNWLDGDASPWPQWSQVMGNAAMPTQHGQAPGKVSMSGGWTWAIPQNSDNQDKAWQLIAMLSDKAHHLKWDIDNVQIPVRPDVAADPGYTSANPSNQFFASLVPITTYRPAYAVYPRISNEIQVASEAVMTGTSSPQDAAKAYDDQVRSIAGDAVMTAAGS